MATYIFFASSSLLSAMSTAMDFLSTHAPIVAISLAIVLATFVIINSRAKKTSDGKKKKYHPFVTNYLKTLVNFSRLHHYMTEMAHKNRSYQAFNFFIDYVITQDPANIEYILKTNFANYGKGWYHNGVLSDVLGDGIFAVDGEKWLHQRKVSSNELATKVAKQFSNTVYKDSAVKLARKISEASTSEKAMEIQDLFMKATLDSIVRIILGIELDTVNGTNEEGTKFAHAFDVANAMTIYRYVDFTWKIRRFLNIGSEAVLKKTMITVDKFVYSLINSKIESVKNSPEAVKKGDMISGLLDLRDSTTGNPKYLRDMILCLIAAGRDTTASTLTWFVYFMGKYPHIQEKVAQEVKKVLNPKENSSFEELAESITEESLEKMQYLHACLTETLRLYPSVPINAKVCLSDDTWPDGFNVKKGNFVGYNAYSMGRMKYLWGDDAEEFRPERWLNENGIFQPESPFKFTAFNAGPRICLGRDHAYRQTKTICAVLVNSFRFKTSDVHKEEPRYMTMISLHVDGGLFVHVSPRSGR